MSEKSRNSDLGQPVSERIPDHPTIADLKKTAGGCTACDLYENATQTVFGEGKPGATLMLVGEQPGDKEDLAGKPFIGPAGRLLNHSLQEAGIERESSYVTNVVKHFKWAQHGKVRLHKKPNAHEIGACKPWLEAEIEVVKPKVVVCLGATAAQALLGPDFRVTQRRGEFVEWSLEPMVTATVHPSSILRARDEATRELERKHFVEDLKGVAEVLRSSV